jgi:hypothetical protein
MILAVTTYYYLLHQISMRKYKITMLSLSRVWTKYMGNNKKISSMIRIFPQICNLQTKILLILHADKAGIIMKITI